MANLLHQYYQGITRQLRSEVDFINSLFEHQGVKGEGNEAALRELITKFIPKKFGVGTGVVIDRHGNHSNQCDIVIYDDFLYPSLLSLTSVHLFPVDLVYATIEVKTTLDSGKAQDALNNIASVKQLDYIRERFTVFRGHQMPPTVSHLEPSPPVGIVFAYKSDVRQFKTYKDWFTPQKDGQTPLYPSLVSCLDQGIVQFDSIPMKEGMIPKGFAVPLAINESDYYTIPDKVENVAFEGNIYPVKLVKGKYVPIDQNRVLLLSLLQLNDVLVAKKINPNIRFSTHYLEMAMRVHVEI